MSIKKLYVNISKTEELDDGTIKVFGFASSEAEDSDGETITADAMKAALPDYLKWGAVREMHQAKAAGTAIEASVQDDGKTWFGAHIVDSEAVKKVKAGVYKGFSIGGKVTARDELNKAIIKGLKLIEVSLVDRPANPDAVLTMYKAETTDETAPEKVAAIDALGDMLNKGEITPERLLELAKANAAGETEPAGSGTEPANSETGSGVKKGMWNVQDFAAVLQSLSYIATDAQWDKEIEGDDSPIPAQLRAWIAQGAEIFQAMAAEETAELIANLKTMAGETETVQMAAQGDDLTKSGAKFSKATKVALEKIHGAAKECCDHLDKLGYQGDDDEDPGKAAAGDDLAKLSGELDTAKADLAKVSAERDTLKTRIAELEKMPAPGKALLKVITKGDDVSGTTAPEVEPVRKHDGSVEDAATLIKSIHRAGGNRIAY